MRLSWARPRTLRIELHKKRRPISSTIIAPLALLRMPISTIGNLSADNRIGKLNYSPIPQKARSES
jgi:hypothetical protein